MRLPVIMMSILFIVNFCADFIIWRDVKRTFKNRWQTKTVIVLLLSMWVLLIIAVLSPRRDAGADLQPIMWMLYTFLSLFIPKLLYALFSIVSRVSLFWKAKHLSVLKYIGGLLAIVSFVAIWWGALVTRNDIEVTRQTVKFENLPKSFDDYKIVHISDIHAGTWGTDKAFLSNMVDTVNALNPDLVLFTGDIVNRNTKEIYPFVSTLSKLKAKQGVYSVLGNHDYGDYMDWSSAIERECNNRELIDVQNKMGWRMLNNEHYWIKEAGDSIAIIGVENWGEPPFSVYGDLRKAYCNLNDDNFKVLLTHNPEHWKREVSEISNIDLSLSGHTHGMQFVLQFCDWKWSPAVWKYKEWGGLYTKENLEGKELKLYVNIGLGEVALPFRLGATPEVTLITLKKENAQQGRNLAWK